MTPTCHSDMDNTQRHEFFRLALESFDADEVVPILFLGLTPTGELRMAANFQCRPLLQRNPKLAEQFLAGIKEGFHSLASKHIEDLEVRGSDD